MKDKILACLIRIARNNPALKKLYKEAVINLSAATNIPEITPFNVRASDDYRERINLLVPSINREHLFGGISTALHFFELLSTNRNCRIITTDAAPVKEDLRQFPNFFCSACSDDLDYECQITPFNDRYNKTLPVRNNDVFIATSWWTAYSAQRIVRWQADFYNQDIKKIIYFIQDFEPGFYSWSSQYALADSTYRYTGPQIAVFNSSLLRNYFHEHHYKFTEEYFFEPKMNHHLKYHLLNSNIKSKKKQILIYGRPSVARNAFTLIIEALKIWVWKYPSAAEWKIVSAGESHQDIDIGKGINVVSKGKMSLNEYGEILQETGVGVSLMVSPHPSYPPLEMAHFGILVLTNHYENKDLSSFHSNIQSMAYYDPDTIADKLCNMCYAFEQNNSTGLLGKSNMPGYLDDSAQFDFIDLIKNNLY